jgi:hypothetical protein
MAQRVTSVEVLRLLISMGPIELMHFQTFSLIAGGVRPLTDPTNGLTFPNLNSGKDPNNGSRGDGVREMFQTNLILPEPCPFITQACRRVRSSVRQATGVAEGAQVLTAMGLFIGHHEFFSFLTDLADAADAAARSSKIHRST